MVPIKLVLAVQEEEYIDPFLRYVHASEFDRRLVVTAFSRKEAFAQYVLESGGDIDAILGDATFLEAVDPLKRPGLCCIQLGKTAISREPTAFVLRSINRCISCFLRLSSLFEEALGHRCLPADGQSSSGFTLPLAAAARRRLRFIWLGSWRRKGKGVLPQPGDDRQ